MQPFCKWPHHRSCCLKFEKDSKMNSEPNSAHLTLVKGNYLSCADFQYLYQDMQDGELSEYLHQEMKHHQCHCSECKSYAEDVEYLVKQARELLKVRPLPADTKQRLYQQLNKQFELNLV